jgi:fibronectin-binding autotransporter adhesin
MLATHSTRRNNRTAWSPVGLVARVAAAGIWLAAAPLRADVNWGLSPSQSGDWMAATNWGGALPTASDTAYIDNGGEAVISQAGAVCNALNLGYNAGDSGSVQMNGGQLTAYIENVGNSGAGIFIQTGGTNTIGNQLNLGPNPGARGSFVLSGNAQLLTAFENVAPSGLGTFTQFGGNNAVSNILNIGYFAGSSGTYSQSGGTNAVSSTVNIGEYSAANGAYTLSGDAQLLAGYENVAGAGTGTFMQSGGTNSVANNLNIAYTAGSTGTYSQSGGANFVGYTLNIGESGSGTYILANSGQLSAPYENVGVSGASVFTQSGGSNTASSLNSGLVLSGTCNQLGGFNNCGFVTLGWNAGASGTFNLSGTSYLTTAQTYSNGAEIVGLGGSGTFTQSGGINNCGSSLQLGVNAGSGGTYNLNGGLLVVSSMTQGVGSAAFNFSGGTLQARTGLSIALPVTLGTSGGGALIDTAGYAVLLTGPLSGAGKLAKVGSGTLTLTGTESYAGLTGIYAGTLKLDFSQTGAPATNIINNVTNASSLTLGGGTLLVQGNAGKTNSQRFNGLSVNPGASAIVLSASSSNLLLLSLGNISRSAGGTVDFTLPVGTQSAANGVTTSNTTVNGILGGYATVSGTNWATTNSTKDIVAYSAYTSGNLGALTSNAAQNVEPSGTQTVATTALSFNTLNLTGALSVMMSSAGKLTLAAGGLIGNTTGNISGGTLEGSASGELIVITPANLTVGSVIADNGGATGLTKAGPATLTLTGGNTYSGATTIGAGTLQIGNGSSGASLRSPSITLVNGASLVFNHSDTVTYNGSISGQGGLVQTGGGTLTITGTNSFGGVDSAGNAYGIASIHQGTINVNSGGVLTSNISEIDVGDTSGQTGTLSMSSGTALVPFGSSGYSGVNVGIYGGKGILSLNGSSLLDATPTNLNNGSGNSHWYNSLEIGLLQGSMGTVTVAGNSILRVANGPFNDLGYIAVGDGGAGALVIQNQGVVQTANFMLGSEFQSGQAGGSGSLYLNGGTLSVPAVQNNAATTGNLYFNGGRLQATAASSDFLQSSGGGTLYAYVQTGGAVIDTNGFVVTVNQPIVHNPGGPTLDGGLTMIGGGTLILAASDNYTGVTMVSAGILSLANFAALDGGGSITFAGGTMQFSSGNSQDYSARIVGSSGPITIDTNGVNVTFASSLASSNTAGLSINGSGTLTLAASNGFTGKTLVSDGMLVLSDSNALSESTFDTSGSGALSFQGGIGGFAFGGLQGSGSLLLTDALSLDVALTVGINNANTTFSGTLSDSNGVGSLTKVGTGRLTLSGTNSYGGGTYVDQGVLIAMDSSAIADGTSLTIGTATFFSPVVPSGSGQAGLQAERQTAVGVPVPEPDTLLTLSAASALVILRRTWRGSIGSRRPIGRR